MHGLLALIVFGTIAGAWLFSLVQLPADPTQPQASVMLYADGTTVLARIGLADRSDVRLDQIPEYVRHAVLAAEDRAFYSHSGVSAKGVLRALWSNVTADDTQGASTITQQYVRNAYLTLDQTVSRKAKEIVLSLKLEHRDSKDQILEHYLNTIYFGRGAYGIEAASRAYFGVGATGLTLAQGVVLAAVIKDPTGLDPANDAAAARDRWAWILDAMVASTWLDPGQRKATAYPTVREVTDATAGPDGYLIDRVEREVKTWGVTDQQLHTAGLKIVTTLDPTTQQAVVAAARNSRGGLVGQPNAAIVAVDPATGGVRGYYGGERGSGYFDDALAARPPGRLFQPLVVAEALSQGISLDSQWNGSSPRTFPDRGGVPLYNRDDIQCPYCRLDVALTAGLNTPLYALAQRVGPDRVADLARRAGVAASYGDGPSLVDAPNEPKPGRTRADVSLGRYPVSVADLASVYATFAGGGTHAERHFVAQLRSADDEVVSHPDPQTRQVLSPGAAADLSFALASQLSPALALPYDVMTDEDKLAFARATAGPHPARLEAAVPFGDDGASSSLWCVSYLPELALVGWLGHDPAQSLHDVAGKTATTATAAIMCRDALTGAFAGREPRALPNPANVGDAGAGEITRGNGDRPAGQSRTTTKPPKGSATPSPSGVTTSPPGSPPSNSPKP